MIAVVEALHDALLRRLNWITHPAEVFRHNCPLLDAQQTIDALTTAFYKSVNELKVVTEVVPEFLDMIKVPELVLDIITNLQMAKTWDDVPFHLPDECEVCELFSLA